MSNFEQIRDDLAAFADDDSDVIVEIDGGILFDRNGETISGQLRKKEAALYVEQDKTCIPYRRFLMNLGRLDLLADRILTKRPSIPDYVDGDAELDRVASHPEEGSALELLHRECVAASPFATRVVFLTADAGHGKTALLREYQHRVARKFRDGQSQFLFWHVDLQGRQLLRLSEALMGDLGELRVPGLWMPAIVRLLRHGALVLAVDGFDELAAEQGGPDALGALALLVQEMSHEGVLIAASRRTFFDTDDYIERSKLLNRSVSRECEFHQLRLQDWSKAEAIKYFQLVKEEGNTFVEPEQIYNELVAALGGDSSHPMVTRPFLATHIAKVLLRYGTTPTELIGNSGETWEGVSSVVKAFVRREVEQKWRVRDTGEPYLSADQHLQLLSMIAEEMWLAGKERLRLDAVEEITRVLLDVWEITPERQRQIIEMVRMHVLLTTPPGVPPDYRAFDHPEFRDYFIATALEERLESVSEGRELDRLRRFVAANQLSDSAARYAVSIINERCVNREKTLAALQELVAGERRPTYVHPNAGTLAAALVHGLKPRQRLAFRAPVICSSLVLENSHVDNIDWVGATFVKPSFRGVCWTNVRFIDCQFTEAIFDARATYDRVVFDSCQFNGIRLIRDNDEEILEYAPDRIQKALESLGMSVMEGGQQRLPAVEVVNEERRRMVHRLLKSFRRSTVVSESTIDERLHSDKDPLIKEIIPLMEKHGVLRQLGPWRGSGPPQTRWSLAVGLKELLRADSTEKTGPLAEFWAEVNSI